MTISISLGCACEWINGKKGMIMMIDILNGLCSRVDTMTLNVVHRFMSIAPWAGQFLFNCNS